MKIQGTVLAVVFLTYSVNSLYAQTPTREISLSAGVSQFDASGTGTGPVAAIRVGSLLGGQWILGDLSFSYSSQGEQFSSVDTRVGVAEGQVQFQLPVRRIRPYLGLGGGWLHYFNNAGDRPATGSTVSGAGGLRVPFSRTLLFRAELRLRAWGSAPNTAAEWIAGVGYTF